MVRLDLQTWSNKCSFRQRTSAGLCGNESAWIRLVFVCNHFMWFFSSVAIFHSNKFHTAAALYGEGDSLSENRKGKTDDSNNISELINQKRRSIQTDAAHRQNIHKKVEIQIVLFWIAWRDNSCKFRNYLFSIWICHLFEGMTFYYG